MRRHFSKMLPVLFIALSMLSFTACDGELGQKLANAGMNTLMGMGVVFVVLILISFVISAFGLINKAEAKRQSAVEIIEPAAPAPVIEEAEEEDLSDDLELVAVIAAAIAASENVSPDGLTVRSIRKVSSRNQWKRG